MIFPSVMARNQNELAGLFKKLSGTSQILHLDVADGKAVPNLSLHFPFRLSSQFKYHAHLMIQEPERWIRRYGNKVDFCIPQFQEVKNHLQYIAWMRRLKKKVAFALSPEISVSLVQKYVKYCDYILILTVKPGFYGSCFLYHPLHKIKLLKKLNPQVKVIVDGGMNPLTIQIAKKAGADYFVSGSYVSKAENSKKAMKELKGVVLH